MGSVKDIDWKDVSVSVPAFLTIAMIPFSYNISYGISFGLISYVVIKLFSGKVKEIKAGTWVITLLFLAMFFLTHYYNWTKNTGSKETCILYCPIYF